MTEITEQSIVAMAAPSSIEQQDMLPNRNDSHNRPIGAIPHGLEFIEILITNYAKTIESGSWTASNTQLLELLEYIASNGGTNKESPAHIFYSYERSTCLFHIFLGPEDTYTHPTLFEERLRSVFIDLTYIEEPRVLTTQFDQIIYNENACRWLGDHNIPWANIDVQDAVDGTLILKFNHQIDFNATRRCMDAANSCWNRSKSHLQLLDEVVNGRIRNPDPNLVYSLALVHPDNENIVPMSEKYPKGTAVLVDVRRKYTCEKVPFSTKDMPNITLPRAKFHTVASWNDLIEMLADMDSRIAKTKKLESEGFVLRVYYDAEKTVLRKILKLQTRVYRELKEMRPNTGNHYELVLGLFLKENLNAYMRWSNIDNETKKWIMVAYKKLVEEVHNVYHMTRLKKNPEIYTALTGSWKSRMFELHGIYLENRKNGINSSVSVNAVDRCLRECPTKEIVHMISDRIQIVKNMRNLLSNGDIQDTQPFYHCSEIEDLSDEFSAEYQSKTTYKSAAKNNKKVIKNAD
jgi:hypothetical protein